MGREIQANGIGSMCVLEGYARDNSQLSRLRRKLNFDVKLYKVDWSLNIGQGHRVVLV